MKTIDKKQQGFTLIELMIVVAIIGILASIAIPAYQDYITRTKTTKIVGMVGALKLAINECFNDTAGNAKACNSLGTGTGATANPELSRYGITQMPAGMTSPSLTAPAVGATTAAADPNADFDMIFVGGNAEIVIKTTTAGGVGKLGGCGYTLTPTLGGDQVIKWAVTAYGATTAGYSSSEKCASYVKGAVVGTGALPTTAGGTAIGA
ncbi:MAG: hypothetical protein RL637_1511 [Pseudomonadota bacterium]